MQLNKNAIYRCATTQDNSGLCTGLDDPFRGSDMPICVMGLCCLTQLRPNTLSDYRTMSLTSWTKPRSLTWEFTVLTTKPMLSHRQHVTQQSNSLFTVGNTTAVLLAFCTNKSNEVKNKWSSNTWKCHRNFANYDNQQSSSHYDCWADGWKSAVA